VSISEVTIPQSRPRAAAEDLREQLSNLQGLLVLSTLMTESRDEKQILHLASTSVPSFGCRHLEGVYLLGSGLVAFEDSDGIPASTASLAQMVAQMGLLATGQPERHRLQVSFADLALAV
jgi:hypothetical protein